MKKNKNKRKVYDSDLTDKQWEIIQPLVPAPKPGGRSRNIDIREIINAIFYLLRSGCVWRLIPNDFPKWQIVYYYFSLWKKDGTWKKIHDEIRGQVRVKAGKKKEPTAGVIDSQSIKTTEKGGFVGMMLVKR